MPNYGAAVLPSFPENRILIGTYEMPVVSCSI